MSNTLQVLTSGLCGAVVYGGAILCHDFQRVDDLREQLADARHEVGRLRASLPLQPMLARRAAQAKISEVNAKTIDALKDHLPKLRELRLEGIRRAAKDDPTLAPILRQLEPEAFATDHADL
jgi:hypothetical protein